MSATRKQYFIGMSKERQNGDAGVGLLQGTLDLLVLRVLVAGPLHGYAITRRLGRTLRRMVLGGRRFALPLASTAWKKKGWIKSEIGRSENNRRARFYALTKNGTETSGNRAGRLAALSNGGRQSVEEGLTEMLRLLKALNEWLELRARVR